MSRVGAPMSCLFLEFCWNICYSVKTFHETVESSEVSFHNGDYAGFLYYRPVYFVLTHNENQVLLLKFLRLFRPIFFLIFVISVPPSLAYVLFFLLSLWSVFWNQEQSLPNRRFSQLLQRGIQNNLRYFLVLFPKTVFFTNRFDSCATWF